MSDRVARHQSWEGATSGPPLSEVTPDGEVEVGGGLHPPGTVMVRVVSSRNLSVQYTDGLEYTSVAQGQGSWGTGSWACSETELRAPYEHRHAQEGDSEAGVG